MEQRHNGAGRGDLLRSVVKAGTTPILARAAATVEAQRVRGPNGELYQSFGDGYTRAFELAVTPALFGLMGYGLDRWLGIKPVLTIVFALVAFVTLLARTWYGYVEKMKMLEAAGPWATATPPAGPVPGTPIPAPLAPAPLAPAPLAPAPAPAKEVAG